MIKDVPLCPVNQLCFIKKQKIEFQGHGGSTQGPTGALAHVDMSLAPSVPPP